MEKLEKFVNSYVPNWVDKIPYLGLFSFIPRDKSDMSKKEIKRYTYYQSVPVMMATIYTANPEFCSNIEQIVNKLF
ncbi:hypothetical protein GF336_00755 [Candidatus Woesearchaeota archaeon]|nr:hypothetical protein [Candidatus Woesearchaeota archaeon]